MIELDLAFDPAPASTVNPQDETSLQTLLQNPEAWIKELSGWLGVMRRQHSPACPDSVRAAQIFSLGLQFTDDATIAELNGNWRKKPEPTDVLSFAALEDAPPFSGDPCLELGDIIVSVPTARRQAQDHGHGLEWELRWLVSHGFLHLLGWDHPDDAHLAAMVQCQEQLLNIGGMFLPEGEE
ncbi:MAG: rRNA maturation RNase YbeY [Synechococcus sp.]|nr:rRNA maturation RNase YbeY [Synechococcus sp.]